MGMTTKPIMFFSDEIAIRPHTASIDVAQRLERKTTIRDFARGQRVSLEQVQETGELIAKRSDGAFLHGPEC